MLHLQLALHAQKSRRIAGRLLVIAVILIGYLPAGTSARGAEPADAGAWLPDEVNVVAWIDVEQLSQSEIARREGWAEQSRQAFLHKSSLLVPGLTRLILGTHLAFEPGLPALQEYVVGVPSPKMNLDTLSLMTGSALDSIGNNRATATAKGSWVAETDTGLWLMAGRGGRQATTRWLRRGPRATPQQPSVLQTLYAERSPKAQVGVLVDLQESVSIAGAKPFLAGVAERQGLTNLDLPTIAAVLASVRSAKLEVIADKALNGRLTVEFGKPVSSLTPLAKTLVTEVLAELGASVSAGDDWQWSVESQALVGSGPLTAGEVRRCLSVLRNPLTLPDAASAPATTEVDRGQQIIEASQRYYQSIETLVDNVQDAQRKTRDNHMLILERYADQIDDLPLLNVDDDLLTFGHRVSSSLRYQAQAIRQAGLQRGVARASSGANTVVRVATVGPYGGWNTTTAPGADGLTIDLTVNASAKSVQISEMKQIREGQAEIRTSLTKKYHAEF